MTKLSWDIMGERVYSSGVNRGVLYPINKPGVAWNGLISVTEKPSGGTSNPYYLDGIKYLNVPGLEEFAATVEAYTYPDEFPEMDGVESSDTGLSYGQQTRVSFGMTYRTELGDDVNSNRGYKIHVIFNALAQPSQTTNRTLNDSPEASTFSWEITTTANRIASRKPTAHLVIDSTKTEPAIMKQLEDILYGSAISEPRLPDMDELVTLFDDWARLEIVPNIGNGLNEVLSRYYKDLKGNSYKGLYQAAENTRLNETALAGLYRLE